MKLSSAKGSKIRLWFIAGYIAVLFVPVSALKFDHDSLDFTALDDLFYPGKQLKIWSDTTIQILTLGFKYRADVGWQRKTNKGIPCTLSAGDTMTVSIYVSYIRSAENPVIDSFEVMPYYGRPFYVPLHVGKFPHMLVTTNTCTGPSLDTAGKNIQFSTDSAYCTLRHKMHYSFSWDDGFMSPWLDIRTAAHSWSVPGLYNVRVAAKCDWNLSTAASLPSSIQIAGAGVSATAGAYKSGFYTRAVNGVIQNIDFSQRMNPVIDSDLLFDKSDSLSAPYGMSTPGIFDSFPTVINSVYSGFAPETSYVCRTYKGTMDSIIGSLHIIAPADKGDTSASIVLKQVYIIRTKEGHFALVVKVGEYIGGIDREYYYWGYQSDGGRMFAPDVSSGQHTAIPPKKLSEAVGIKVIKKVHGIQLFLPEGRSIKEVSIYNCNGSLLYHNSMNIAKTTVTKFVRLPKGFYVVSVQTEKEKIIRRLCID